jgi:hypothetical protein
MAECEHDYHWSDPRHDEMPECLVHVDCDENCRALTDPQTVEELKAALTHWRSHPYLCGCSHGT